MRAKSSILRVVAALFLLVAASACGTRTPDSAKEAVVVVGLAKATPGAQFTGGGIGVIWRPYNVATNSLISVPLLDEMRFSRGYGGVVRQLSQSDEEKVSPEYNVKRVIAGEYVLAEITASEASGLYGGSINKITSLVGTTKSTGLFGGVTENRIKEGPIQGRSPYRVTIRPGETVYLGDFYLDVSKFPGTISRIGRSDAAASVALAKEMPGRTGMVFRSPVKQ
jgi:hypothetical protein